MSQAVIRYGLFVTGVFLLLAGAAVPIVASDLFREPYSPWWDTVYELADWLRIDPFPTGGGAPPQFPYWRDPADAGLYFENVPLHTADGVRLDAWFVPAEPGLALGEQPTIILAHGLQDRKTMLLHLVLAFHEAEYHVMVFDFRGHGNSEKQPVSVGPKEALDVQAALDWLESRGVADRVGGLGMSMGAAALVNTAVQDPRLDALVLDSLFAEWSDTDFARDYRLSPDWLVPGVPDPEMLVPDVRVPVFLIHGTADILTDVDHAHRLYRAANEPKELWINDSGHAWSSWTYPQVYQDKVIDFFNRALDHAPNFH